MEWKNKPRKWTIKEATSIEGMSVRKLSMQDKADLAHFLYTNYQRRLGQFSRAGREGYAQHVIQKKFDRLNEKGRMMYTLQEDPLTIRGKTRILSNALAGAENPNAALTNYILMFQDFFKSESSTVKGWKRITENQDKRLFGIKNRLGNWSRPAHRMADAERIRFWSVYDELVNTGWTTINDYSSDSQRAVAALWLTEGLTDANFETAYHRLQELLDARPVALRESPPNVSSDPIQQGDGLEGSDYFAQ